MASNSRYDQTCEQVTRRLATLLGYTTVSPQDGGDDGFVLSGGDPQPDIRVYKLEQNLHAECTPPRVVFVAQGGGIVPPDQVGAYTVDGQSVRNIRTRLFRIRVYCWGTTTEQSEDLVHNVINAFEDVAHNSVNFDQETWEDQQTGQGGQETYGRQISFYATVAINVTTLPQKLTTVQHVKMTVTELDSSVEIDV